MQKRYLVMEQELLAIVETLKYFKHMLLWHVIIIKITHLNSTHTSNKVLHQRLLLEEYGVELEILKVTEM